MARAKAGDAAAFRELYDDTYAQVYALALRLTAEPAQARELLQDTYVAAWKGLAGFRGDATFVTWLHTITVRLLRRHWRTRLRRSHREQGSLEFARAISCTTPGVAVDLELALASLPPRARSALVLHCIHGYSQLETGRILGVAEGTIKAHIHRARELLRRRLDHDA